MFVESIYRKDQFIELILICLEGTGRTGTLYNGQYDEYMSKKLKGVLFTSFQKFCKSNPILVWGAMYIQEGFRNQCLGRPFWDKKMEQFRLVRKELGLHQV